MAGFSSLEEAVVNPATNNITTSVLVQEFITVTDGNSILRVETTAKSFVRAEDFRINYAYVDATTGATNNDGISIILNQKDDEKVVVPSSLGSTKTTGGYIYGTTYAPHSQNIYTATISLQKGSLKRDITL